MAGFSLRRLHWDIAFIIISHMFIWPFFMLGTTVAILYYGSNIVRALFVGACCLYVLTYYDKSNHTGARVWPAFQRFWVNTHDYFPVKMLMWDGKAYSQEPNEGHERVFDVDSKRFIFAMHPHGAIPLGGAVFRPQLTRWPKISDALYIGAADAVFGLPIIRDCYLWFGTVRADKRTMVYHLNQGHSVMLLPGGIHEQLWVCGPDEEVVYLKNRKGFIRLALETGADLVPVFVFGERRGFVMNKLLTIVVSRLFKRLLRIGMPLPRGRWYTLLPFPVPITIVVGKPMPVEKVAEPTQAQVDALHATYTTALRNLYDEHKKDWGYENVTLNIT